MRRLGINESDFEERFVRAGGPGGQNVNKVSTCVVLRHRPTGLEVRCARERSQSLNRYLARRILIGKIEASVLGAQAERERMIQKIRRQKRKRSKRAKDKILHNKKHRSKIKAARAKPSDLADY